jgi:hypothetical protein
MDLTPELIEEHIHLFEEYLDEIDTPDSCRLMHVT